MDLYKTLIGIVLAGTTTLALAAPVFAYLATPLIAGITVGQVVFLAASLIYGAAQQRSAKKRAAAEQRRQIEDHNAGLANRTLNGIGSDFPARHVYGTARIGGNIVDILTTGNRDQFQHLIVLATQHQVDEISEIYLNSKPVGLLDIDGLALNAPFGKIVQTPVAVEIPFGDDDVVLEYTPITGSVSVTYSEQAEGQDVVSAVPFTLVGNTVTTSTVFTNYIKQVKYLHEELKSSVRITKHLGIPGGSFDVKTHNDTNGKLKTTSVFNGHSYIALRLDLNEPEFQNLPSIELLVKRENLFDVRTGANSANAGSNPALVAYDYLSGPLCNVNTASLPTAKYITAANDCDFSVNNGDGSRKKYTFNGMISSDQSREQVLQDIADSMAGGIVATTWDIFAGVYRAPIMSLTESDIVGTLSVTPGASGTEIYNTAYGKYASQTNNWLVKEYDRYVQSAYLSADGEELEIGISYPNTITQTAIDQLNRINIEQSRNSYTISATFSLKAWKLVVGDRISWTSSFMGQAGTVYRVVDRSTGYGNGVKLMLKQDSPTIYDLVDATAPPSVPPSTLPDPWIVDAPQSITIASGTSALTTHTDGTLLVGMRVGWMDNPLPTGVIGSLVELQVERLTGANLPETMTLTVPNGSDRIALVAPVREGEKYRVKLRATNAYNRAVSAWVYAAPHVVVGKTEPPGAVDRYKVIEAPGGVRQHSWQMLKPPLDLFSFEIAYTYGNQRPAFKEMQRLSAKDGIARQTETFEPTGDGVYTFAIRAVDTTGIASLPKYSTVTLIADQFSQIEAFSFPHQNNWPGTKLDCFVSQSILKNKGQKTWGSFNTDTWGSTPVLWGNTPYSPITYSEIIDRTTILARTLRVESIASGVSTLTELRTSNDGVIWTAWAEVPSGSVSARYYEVRWTVSGSDPELYKAQIIFYI